MVKDFYGFHVFSGSWLVGSYFRGVMKNYTKYALQSLPVLLAAAALTACDVDKTQDGELPSVDVEVEGEAKLPKYDVDAPDVDIKKKKVEVEVPTIEVTPAGEDTNDQ